MSSTTPICSCCGVDTHRLYEKLVQMDQMQLIQTLRPVDKSAASLIIRLLNKATETEKWEDIYKTAGDDLDKELMNYLEELSSTNNFTEFNRMLTPMGFLRSLFPEHSDAINYLVLSWLYITDRVSYGTGLDHCWLKP